MGSNKKNFSLESAERIATKKVPTIFSSSTIGELVSYLENKVSSFDSIDYIYVLNRKRELVGVLSIKETLRQPRKSLVSSIMKKDIVKAAPFTDQEKISYLSLKNNIKAVPVVDKNHKFLGAVLSDTILKVLYGEMREDIAHLAGAPDSPEQSAVDMSVGKIIKHRLPWLFLGLVGGILAAEIVGIFEHTLSENIILASFMPLIMYMGGATLSQTQAFFIRDLAFRDDLPFLKYVLKQLAAILVIALVLSGVIYLISFFRFGFSEVGTVLAVALFAVLCTTVITGLFIPLFFLKIKKDPADGSGPLSTIIQDILGVMIYFLIASWLLF